MSLFGRRGPSVAEVKRDDYIKKNLTASLAESTRRLQKKYVASDEPIRSDDAANAVCNILEAMLLHGLKSSFSNKVSSFLLIGSAPDHSPQPSFWEFLQKFTHKDVISQLNHLGQITTEIGMCRSWLRLALNEGLMESYLDAMATEEAVMRHYYKRTAYLRDDEQAGIMKSYVQGLLNLNFNLSYNSSVLNMWSSTPLLLAGITDPLLEPTPAIVIPEVASEISVSPAHSASLGSEASIAAAAPKQSKARLVSSIRYHGTSEAIPSPPATTPFNSGQLTANDIDEIRQLTAELHGASESTSTATSQISHPDPTPLFIPQAKRKKKSNTTSPEGSTDAEPMTSQTTTGESGKRLSVLANYKSGKLLGTTPEEDHQYWVPSPVVPVLSEAPEEKPSPSASFRSCETASLLPGDNSPTASFRSCSPSVGDNKETPSCLDTHSSCPTPSASHDTVTDGTLEDGTVTWLEGEGSGGDSANSQDVTDADSFTTALSEDMPSSIAESSAAEESTIQQQSQAPSSHHLDVPSRPRAPTCPSIGDSPIPVDSPTRRSSFPAEFSRLRRKSLPLEPVETLVTAVSTFVEVATEVKPTTQLMDEEGDEAFEPPIDNEDEYYARFPRPMPQSNSIGAGLGLMKGWSSDFETDERPSGPGAVPTLERSASLEDSFMASTGDAPKDRSVSTATNNTEGSFDDLLHNYGPGMAPIQAPSMSKVLEELNTQDPTKPASPVHTPIPQPRSQTLESIVGLICTEKGLDMQNYQCQGCSRPVGIIYGKARVCTYDACYYCYECHENREYYIPSRILHNWDFRKHEVANHTLKFLQDIEDRPVLDVNAMNPRLYDHADEMKELMLLRTQLRSLKAYLFTCKQSVADDLKRQLWPKDYLYEELHAYSLQDLLNVVNGQLAITLRKVVKWASDHVYKCRLCSQKGFICEICNSPKVIYPFETEATVNCDRCKSVFHRGCKTEVKPCPKCDRRMRRSSSVGLDLDSPHAADYAFAPSPKEEESRES